jgi:LAS superfamily LD-carboxypeptidase LdcB
MSDVSGRKEYLSNAAAIKFNKMVADAKNDGVNIKLTDAYRACGQPGDYKNGKWTQWSAWEKYKFHGGNLAASPYPPKAENWNKNNGGYCTSNHGFGNAIDVEKSGWGWVKKNGEKYGWYWGEAKSEDWHFTFCGDGVVNTPGFCAGKIKIKKDKNPIETRLPKNIQDLMKKLKDDWGVNITKSHIDKEYDMEGDVRPDAGGVNSEALKQITKLISDCKTANPTVNFPNPIKHGVSGLASGYRSYNDQVDNFGNKVKNEGRSIDNVQSSNTLPGFSQHHTGRAFDIFSTETSWWNTNSDVKKWVANNCKKYGFEVTYTKTNKLRIPEPWHLFYK